MKQHNRVLRVSGLHVVTANRYRSLDSFRSHWDTQGSHFAGCEAHLRAHATVLVIGCSEFRDELQNPSRWGTASSDATAIESALDFTSLHDHQEVAK